MLQTLPFELILNICSHLKFKDKLNLKTTCHQLNNNITKAVLYEHFYIKVPINRENDFRKKNMLLLAQGNKLLQKLKDKQLEASLIKVLHMNIDGLSYELRLQLSTYFPNLTRIKTSKTARNESKRSDNLSKARYTREPLTRWRNTIETIISRYDWETLLHDLLWSKYPRLTELDLGGLDYQLKKWLAESSVSFFTNMPLLKRLTLRDAKIDDLEVLEAIHAGCPLLESLRLFSPFIRSEEYTPLPQSIVPACSVLYFELFDSKRFNTNGPFMDYVLKKYTNLEKLVFDINPFEDYHAPFDDRAPPISPSTDLAMNQAYFLRCHAYESKFYSHLPKSLKTLILKINHMDNAVAALAEANSNITTLDILHYQEFANWRMENRCKRMWQDPNMLDHFKRLTSLKTLRIPLSSALQVFTSEFISVSVTRLVIAYYKDSFSMEWILSMFPSLEQLYINPPESIPGHPLEFNIRGRTSDSSDSSGNTKGSSAVKIYPKLRLLSFKKCMIHPKFFNFIKSAAPNLEELDLKLYLPRTLEIAKHKFDLSHWHLNKCYISFIGLEFPRDVRCIVTIDNISRCVEISDTQNVLVPAGRKYMYDRQLIIVEVISDSMTQLKISDFPIVKVGDKIMIDLFQ